MKKFGLCLMAAVMMCSFTACGSKDNATTTTENTEAVVEDTTADATTDVTEQAGDATNTEVGEIGTTLKTCFQDSLASDATLGAQALADALLKTQEQYISGASMPVEPGLLTGFANAEITGFSEAVMFSPMVGTHPFVGYVFVLEDGTDVEAFKTLLKDNADMRWNICTEAEDMVIENVDNKVLFVMCPKSWETP